MRELPAASRPALTPDRGGRCVTRACDTPDTGTGGQNDAQLPSQVETGPVSHANKDSVRPCVSRDLRSSGRDPCDQLWLVRSEELVVSPPLRNA